MKIKTSHEINIILTFEDTSDTFYDKKWVAFDDLLAHLQISMNGDSHTEFQKGYWKACKDILELLEGEK